MVVLVPSADPWEQNINLQVSKWELVRNQLGGYKWTKISATVPVNGEKTKYEDINVYIPTLDEQTFEAARLNCDGWTLEETLYFLELCRSYELRFIVIADRYQHTARSVIDLKARYYQILNRLGMSDFLFDAEGEQRRRLAEESFEARPKEQIDEEQQLLRIVTAMQSNLYATWQQRQSIIASVAGDTFLMNSAGLPDILGVSSPSPSQISEELNSPVTASNSSHKKAHRKVDKIVQSSPDQFSSGKKQFTPVLRTSLLKPIKAGLARQVDKMLLDMGLPPRPVYPSERNCELYDQIRAHLADSIELKRTK